MRQLANRRPSAGRTEVFRLQLRPDFMINDASKHACKEADGVCSKQAASRRKNYSAETAGAGERPNSGAASPLQRRGDLLAEFAGDAAPTSSFLLSGGRAPRSSCCLPDCRGRYAGRWRQGSFWRRTASPRSVTGGVPRMRSRTDCVTGSQAGRVPRFLYRFPTPGRPRCRWSVACRSPSPVLHRRAGAFSFMLRRLSLRSSRKRRWDCYRRWAAPAPTGFAFHPLFVGLLDR